MAVLLVTYDLHNHIYENDLLSYIKGHTSWAKLAESSYVIATDHTPDVVSASIQNVTKNNVTVYVMYVRRPYSGYGPKEVNDWLDRWLPWQ